MYPSLPFGPLSLPTAPFFAILAVWLGLETASRLGRIFRLRNDDVWNSGLVALAAGLIVARLWNVVQFAHIYLEEPLLIFSLRPSGFVLLPGLVAAAIAFFIWMVRKALSPASMAATMSIGLLAAAICLSVGAHLSGTAVGVPSRLIWAQPYYDTLVHPVGLYRAGGFLIVLILSWKFAQPQRPLRTLLMVGFGAGLVRLISDAFLVVPGPEALLGGYRISQLGALALALICALLLARTAPSEPPISTLI